MQGFPTAAMFVRDIRVPKSEQPAAPGWTRRKAGPQPERLPRTEGTGIETEGLRAGGILATYDRPVTCPGEKVSRPTNAVHARFSPLKKQ